MPPQILYPSLWSWLCTVAEEMQKLSGTDGRL